MSMYLHVRLTVANSKVDDFVENAKAFLTTHFLEENPNRWQLLAAMEIDKASDYALVTPPVKDPSTTFVNLWALPEPLNLADVMFQLSEYGPYVTLDNDVTHEIQEVIYRVNSPDGLTDEALAKKLKAGHSFAMVRHYPSRQFLAEFAVSAGALSATFAEQAKFTFGGSYQNITGLLNEFWDFWLLDKAHSCDALRKTLAGLIEAEKTIVGDSYRESIGFAKDGPDDGILILKKARFWV